MVIFRAMWKNPFEFITKYIYIIYIYTDRWNINAHYMKKLTFQLKMHTNDSAAYQFDITSISFML